MRTHSLNTPTSNNIAFGRIVIKLRYAAINAVLLFVWMVLAEHLYCCLKEGEFSMKFPLWGHSLALLILANNYSWGQAVAGKTFTPVAVEESADLQQIRRESQAFVEAFNKKDAPRSPLMG